jgi:hypothetical protein
MQERLKQRFGSGLDLDSSIRPVDPYTDPDSESGSRRAKMTNKNRKNFMFCSAGCTLLRPEGFFCSLDVLYEGAGIGKLYFFFNIKNKIIFLSR